MRPSQTRLPLNSARSLSTLMGTLSSTAQSSQQYPSPQIISNNNLQWDMPLTRRLAPSLPYQLTPITQPMLLRSRIPTRSYLKNVIITNPRSNWPAIVLRQARPRWIFQLKKALRSQSNNLQLSPHVRLRWLNSSSTFVIRSCKPTPSLVVRRLQPLKPFPSMTNVPRMWLPMRITLVRLMRVSICQLAEM
jgi:hypothetical protein